MKHQEGSIAEDRDPEPESETTRKLGGCAPLELSVEGAEELQNVLLVHKEEASAAIIRAIAAQEKASVAEAKAEEARHDLKQSKDEQRELHVS